MTKHFGRTREISSTEMKRIELKPEIIDPTTISECMNGFFLALTHTDDRSSSGSYVYTTYNLVSHHLIKGYKKNFTSLHVMSSIIKNSTVNLDRTVSIFCFPVSKCCLKSICKTNELSSLL